MRQSENIVRRYQAFVYKYKECPSPSGKTPCCDPATAPSFYFAKAQCFFYNYEQYWLNVYRPFDEYDIEANLSSGHILHGFHWIRGICTFFCRRTKATRKTMTEKCISIWRYLMDNFCNLFIVITTFLFVYALFVMAQQLSGIERAKSENIVFETNNTAYYGICSDNFGALEGEEYIGNYDLSVIDMAVLTHIVYEADNYDLCQTLDVYLNGTYEIIKINREEPFYFHIRHKVAPIDIISVRGTENTLELLQDVSLFAEVGIFKGLSWVVPFLNS